MLNQLFLLVFMCFSVLFMNSATFHMKSAVIHENQQNQVNMCAYLHHLHIHAPPNTTKIWDIPSWPFLCTVWKPRSKWEICVESAVFVAFQVLTSAFHLLFTKSATFHAKSTTFHENQQNQVSMCVYMHHLHTRTCTTCTAKYHQNIRYTVPSWHSLCTLWKTRSKWEICVESAVFVGFQWKHSTFVHAKFMSFMVVTKYMSFVYNERPDIGHIELIFKVHVLGHTYMQSLKFLLSNLWPTGPHTRQCQGSWR